MWNEELTGYVPTESKEQETVFAWANIMELIEPRLELLHHVPNGGFRKKGTAARMKAEGVKAGVPDIFLPVPAKRYHGLYIEMKKRDHSNGLSKIQRQWIGMLREQGYKAEVAYGCDEAIEMICQYLDIEDYRNVDIDDFRMRSNYENDR